MENYVGIPLTQEQQRKLQELVDSAPTRTEEEIAAHALEVGVDRLLDGNDELADEPTAQEEVALLARAFQVREELKTPSSTIVSLSTMDRFSLDQLIAATGMNLEEVAKMMIAKGIAALMKEHGVERRKARTPSVSGMRNVSRL